MYIRQGLMFDGFNGTKYASLPVKQFLHLHYEHMHEDMFLIGAFR